MRAILPSRVSAAVAAATGEEVGRVADNQPGVRCHGGEGWRGGWGVTVVRNADDDKSDCSSPLGLI